MTTCAPPTIARYEVVRNLSEEVSRLLSPLVVVLAIGDSDSVKILDKVHLLH